MILTATMMMHTMGATATGCSSLLPAPQTAYNLCNTSRQETCLQHYKPACHSALPVINVTQARQQRSPHYPAPLQQVRSMQTHPQGLSVTTAELVDIIRLLKHGAGQQVQQVEYVAVWVTTHRICIRATCWCLAFDELCRMFQSNRVLLC